MAQRGQLTEEINDRAMSMLQRPISQDELHLMHEAMQCAMSGRSLDEVVVNPAKRDMLNQWREAGWADGEDGHVRLTYDFWQVCSELVWDAYCRPE